MTAVDLDRFLAGDVTGWQGLPADVSVADLADAAAVDPDDVGSGLAGDPPEPRTWLALPSGRWAGGVLAWVDGTSVVLVEARGPVDEHGDPPVAPDLGSPEATFDTALGRLRLADGERVYAGRGLAVRSNPANGVLLALLGFAPTTVEDYRTRLRPHLEPRRLLTVRSAP